MKQHKTPGIIWNPETPWQIDAIRYRDGSKRTTLGEHGDPFILTVEHHKMTASMREEVAERGWLKTRISKNLLWLRPDMEKTPLYLP